MEIGGFITSGAEIVNHDASLSGNGTVDSPLGVAATWTDISNQCTIGAHEGDCKVYVNSASRLCWMCGAWKPRQNGAYVTVPVQYAWPSRFEIANNVGKHLDFNATGNNNVASVREADASGTYWSECIFWGY